MTMEKKGQTYGEWRVGLDFNPSGMGEVELVKKTFADLIDAVHVLYSTTQDAVTPLNVPLDAKGEKLRLYREAMDDLDTACMKVVKGLTKKGRS